MQNPEHAILEFCHQTYSAETDCRRAGVTTSKHRYTQKLCLYTIVDVPANVFDEEKRSDKLQ